MPEHFGQGCSRHRQDWKACDGLGLALSSCVSGHYLLETACNIRRHTLAAIAPIAPSRVKQTTSGPPQASRGSAAWVRNTPGTARPPLPRHAVHAAAGRLIGNGQLGMAGEPGDGRGMIYQVPLWSVLAAMRLVTPPKASLWGVSLGAPTAQDSRACQALKRSPLTPHLYRPRHGGASDDLRTGRRSPREGQRRARWAVASPMRRCGKEGSRADVMARVSAFVSAFEAVVQ